ncbi:hypothetical protein GUJ93_ZPchr0004g39779 [Zizania palustris]|uniref:Uncharacterized protein n=1 Tax=Zizania palustris TaxID=103762 RepID=A0A8J5S1M5_ZIZPA|nr:hypothetical protein GUJ93_ZPchr0004g39779 [Zizania palustris]
MTREIPTHHYSKKSRPLEVGSREFVADWRALDAGHIVSSGIIWAAGEAFDSAVRELVVAAVEGQTRPWTAAQPRQSRRVEGFGDLEFCDWFPWRR